MIKTPIIIDTDPGVDDTIAILMCLANPNLDVKAITTVGGNLPVEYTSRNAQQIVELAKADVKVVKGAEGPLISHLKTAEDIHAEGGLGGIKLPNPTGKLYEKDPADTIYEEAMAADGKLKILAIAPQTNIATAILKYPILKEKIDTIVFMGGTTYGGNVTIGAEFNAYVDPEALKIVLNSGINLVMVGLNVTHETVVTKEQNQALKKFNSEPARVITEMIDYMNNHEWSKNFKGALMHDPLAASVLMDSNVIKTKHYFVDIELKGELTRGATIIDYYNKTRKPPNVHVAMNSDNERFLEILEEMMGNYDKIKIDNRE